jgi:alpha-amylase
MLTCDYLGWTRLGHPSHSAEAGLAVILNASYASYTSKRMNVGRHHAWERWTDILGWAWGAVEIDGEGWGVFPVGPRSVGVWVNERAPGRREVDGLEL